MYWFIIVIASLLFAIVCLILASSCDTSNAFKEWCYDHSDGLGIHGGILLFVNLVALIFMTIDAISVPDNARRTEYEYENTKLLIQSYKGNDYGNMTALTEKVISLNDAIAKNKAYCKSPWRGVWNSKKIGDLQPIVLNVTFDVPNE